MSFTKLAIISAVIAYVEARFGQEGLLNGGIGALNAIGEPGQAATLGGQVPGVLLAGAGPCAKVSRIPIWGGPSTSRNQPVD
jgi:hypothetical protein